jgi:hypothetical protein
VLVAQRDPREGAWMNPVIAPPLEAGQTCKLAWLDRVNDTGLGVTYSDFEGHEYTSTLGGEQTRAYEGHLLPTWSDGEKERYWSLSAGQAVGSQWAPKKSDFRTG